MQKLLNQRYAAVLAIALIVALLPLVFPSAYYYRVTALVFIFALATIGLNLLMGVAGQVSLGHAGFMGLGAYSAAMGQTQLGLGALSSMLVGAALAGLVAWIVGRPILKLKGHYLAVATLGFGILISMVLANEARWTGGPDGMTVPRTMLFGLVLRGAQTWYWIAGGILVLGAALAINLINSPSGRALRAVHDSEIAARVCGVDVASMKLKVFVISAVYASIAGSILAFLNGHITPDGAGFLRSIELVTMVVFGGMGSILGSLVGAAIIVILPQALTAFHDYEHFVLGLIMILCMIFLREGVVPSIAAKLRRRTA